MHASLQQSEIDFLQAYTKYAIYDGLILLWRVSCIVQLRQLSQSKNDDFCESLHM